MIYVGDLSHWYLTVTNSTSYEWFTDAININSAAIIHFPAWYLFEKEQLIGIVICGTMYQLFALCAPEWIPKLGFNTKLKDQLFNGEAEYVVETIAVPVRPADVHPIANPGQLATAPK